MICPSCSFVLLLLPLSHTPCLYSLKLMLPLFPFALSCHLPYSSLSSPLLYTVSLATSFYPSLLPISIPVSSMFSYPLLSCYSPFSPRYLWLCPVSFPFSLLFTLPDTFGQFLSLIHNVSLLLIHTMEWPFQLFLYWTPTWLQLLNSSYQWRNWRKQKWNNLL